MHLRAVEAADLPSLYAAAGQTAWQQLLPDQLAAARPEVVAQRAAGQVWQTLTAPGGGGVVADAVGTIVGYLLWRVAPGDLTGEPEALFVDIWVDPRLRRQGLGQRLVQAAEAAVAAQGARRVGLVIRTGNAGSLANARQCGYTAERIVFGKVLAGVPAAGT